MAIAAGASSIKRRSRSSLSPNVLRTLALRNRTGQAGTGLSRFVGGQPRLEFRNPLQQLRPGRFRFRPAKTIR